MINDIYKETKLWHFTLISEFVLASLSTSNHYRSKSSSLPPIGKIHSIPNVPLNENDTNNLSPSTIPNQCKSNQNKSAKHQRPQSAIVLGSFDPMTASIFNEPIKNTVAQDRKTTRSK